MTRGITPLADLSFTAPPSRLQLVEQLRPRLGEIIPSFHLVAESMLGADSLIDFVGVEPSGRVVVILLGAEGEDLEMIGRALAQRAWVEPRIRDWIKLAPNLGARLGAGVRVVLLCASFHPETEAAAAALGPNTIHLARYRCLRDSNSLEIVLEPSSQASIPPPPPNRPTASNLPPFRTGLTDDDLDLTTRERSDLE
jgi:hypothetical protein